MPISKSPVGILLVNFGVPDKPDSRSVVRFLHSYMSDGRVTGKIKVAVNRILRFYRHSAMVDEATRRFAEISDEEGFPYTRDHGKLRRMVIEELRELGADNVVVTVAFRYGKPSMRQGFTHLRKTGCKHIIVVPLYPQSSYSFTASVHDEYRREKRGSQSGMEYRFLDSFYDDPGYIRAVADKIIDSLPGNHRETKILFVYRAIPLKDVSRGDTYELQTSTTSLAVARLLKLDRKKWTIAYLPYDQMAETPCLTPSTDETIDRFIIGNVRNVAVVCPGQLFDSVDTTFEIDERLRERFETGINDFSDSFSFTYVPAIGCDREFARALSEVIYGNLYGWEVYYSSGIPVYHGKSADKTGAMPAVERTSKTGSLPVVERTDKTGSIPKVEKVERAEVPSDAHGNGKTGTLPVEEKSDSEDARAKTGAIPLVENTENEAVQAKTAARPSAKGEASGEHPGSVALDINENPIEEMVDELESEREREAAETDETGVNDGAPSVIELPGVDAVDPNTTMGGRHLRVANGKDSTIGGAVARSDDPNATSGGSHAARPDDPNATSGGSHSASPDDPSSTSSGSHSARPDDPNSTSSGSHSARSDDPNATSGGSRAARSNDPNATSAGSRAARSDDPDTTGSRPHIKLPDLDDDAPGPDDTASDPNKTGKLPQV
ncbi:MAG: ferrochelatase [Coriobacteriales bacterium]|jgi:ferrochelatase